LAAGSHSITAAYSGDASDAPSTSAALAQTVSKVNSSATLGSSVNPSTAGRAVTFSAVVSPAAATVTVQFLDGGTLLGTVALSGGTASLGTAALGVGTHSISAVYCGDGTYNGASQTLAQSVKASLQLRFLQTV